MKTTLLIDGQFMAHRAFHTTGGLSLEDLPTGIAFGILRDIDILMDTFDVRRVVWTFDKGPLKRKEIYPEYKANREHPETIEEQLADLQEWVLADYGFRNVFSVEGYEADDIIAKIAYELIDTDGVIVSADNDLWQCLSSRVSFFNPITRKTTTESGFIGEWGIRPEEWSTVKAMAGCRTDNVEGIKGVGPKTAAKFIRSDLKVTTKAYRDICIGSGTIMKNTQLVSLPLSGLPRFELLDDEITEESKAEVRGKLGIKQRRRVGAERSRRAGELF